MPKVAGSPPWEPAPRPQTELPWTATPARRPAISASAAGPLPQRSSQPPQPSPWDALAEEAWPGGPQASRPQPSRPAAATADTEDTAGAAVADAGTGGTGGLFGGAGDEAGSAREAEVTARADEIRSRWSSFLPRRASEPEGAGTGLWAGSAGRPAVADSVAAEPWRSAAQDRPAVTGAAAPEPWRSTTDSGMLSAGLPESGPEPPRFTIPPVSTPSWGSGPVDATGSGPLYSWSPSDATESLPAVSPEEDQGR